MNLRTPVTALAAFSLLTGCGAVAFDVDVTSETTVGGGGLFEQFVPPQFQQFMALDLSQTEEFQNQGVSPEDVDSIRLKSLVLEVVTPEGADLSFIDALTFFAEAQGQPKVRVAHLEDPAFDGQGTVALEIDDVELAPYITSEQMSLTTEVRGRRPPDDTTIKATAVFRVDPNIAGS